MRYNIVRSCVRSRRVSHFTRPSFIPHVEHLEQRITPDVVWTGKGPDNEWGTPANWNDTTDDTIHRVPTKTDLAIFNSQAKGKQCAIPFSYTCGGLDVGATYNGELTIAKGATLTLQGAGGRSFIGGSVIDGDGNIMFRTNLLFLGGAIAQGGLLSFEGTKGDPLEFAIRDGGVGKHPSLNRNVSINAFTKVYWGKNVDVGDGAHITNGGTFYLDNGATIGPNDKAWLTNKNQITLLWSGVQSTATLAIAFNNSGTVNIDTKSTLEITNGGSSGKSSFMIGAGSSIKFRSPRGRPYGWWNGTTFTGDGAVVVAGSVNVPGAAVVTATTLSIEYGALSLGEVFPGQKPHPASLTVSKNFNWLGGAITTEGTLTIAKGAQGVIQDKYQSLMLDNAGIDNYGSTSILGNIQFKRVAGIENYGILDSLRGTYWGQGLINNNPGGQYYRRLSLFGHTQTVGGAIDFSNSGEAVFESGQEWGHYIQSGGSTEVDAGAQLQVDNPMDMESGVLTGAGQIAGDLKNVNGTFIPGSNGGPGIFGITGNYTQTNGALNIVVNGTTAGTGYSQVNITGGQAKLGGWLNVNMTNCPLAQGETFQIMKCASWDGSYFQNVNITGRQGYIITVNYDPQDVTLVVNAPDSSSPTVTGISPNSGPTGGGTLVTITGTHLTPLSGVEFGNAWANHFGSLSSTSIQVYSPAHFAQTVDVVVVTQNGGSQISSNDQYTYTASAAPTVTGISPSSGPVTGGTSVTITGTSFTGASTVFFGATAATSFSVNSDTQITATAPAGSAGTVDVTVTTPTGTSATASADHYTYTTLPIPTVSGVTPATGPTGGGTIVTVTGTNFAGTSSVNFGTLPAISFTVNSATQITATSPPHWAGTVDITVSTGGGTSATGSSDRFSFTTSTVPTVTGVSPSSGSASGGTVVQITGTYLTGAGEVVFGTITSSNFTVNSSGLITAVAPPNLVGTVDITIVTPTGTSAVSAADQFTYTAASVPTVTGISPTSGPTSGGTVVTITGTNFTGASGVQFGSTAASQFTIYSSMQIVATSPAEAAGTIDITVTTPGATSATSSADHFTYSAGPAPSVSSVTPSSGPGAGGTSVIVVGSNFSGATNVSFGGLPAASFVVNTPNQITATSPAHAAGVVDVQVTTAAGSSSQVAADHFTYTTSIPPAITGISPTSGPTSGGTHVNISGSGFTGATTVQFGSLYAASFTVYSDGQIVAVSPAEQAGTVDVTVTTASGTSALGSADRFTFTAAAVPTITFIAPISGPTLGGTPVAIVGTNFTGAFALVFGRTPATRFIVNSSTSITAISPPHTQGTVDIQVATPSGVSSLSAADQFTYNSGSAGFISHNSTGSGSTSGGTTVTLRGGGFTGTSGVSFGNVPASSFIVYSDTVVVATSPPESSGTVDITVTGPNGTSSTSSADQFTYTSATAPSVSAVALSSGTTAGGTVVAITGSHFSGATSVSFGSLRAAGFTVYSDTAIIATSPLEAAGTVDITVTTLAGTSSTSSADHFTFTNVTGSAPTVTAVSPNSGSTAGGMSVIITGTNFAGTTGVSFGTTAATSFIVNSAGQITATAPAKAAGTYDITVTTNNGTSSTSSADQFTYVSTPAPAVTSLSPSTGTTAGGTSVVITGTNFSGATAVSFGSYAATTFSVNSSTQITATAPPQAAGVVDVLVTTPSGISAAVSGDHFTYTAAGLPAITSLSPTSGSTAGGTSVTITGSGFTGATGVTFDSAPAAGFTVNSDTSITATTPPYAAGTFNVTVTTFSGTSALVNGDRFTFTLAATPSITSLGTTSGTTAGGTSVTITGSAFTGAGSVYFGAVAAASFTVNSDTSITATSPPEAAGTVAVTVTTPSGTSASGSGNQFTYTAASAPSVTSVSPNTGTTGGGTSITITGSGFTGATGVSFGTFAAIGFSVSSDTQIIATAPPQAAATVDITVTTYAGTSSTSANDHYVYTAAAAPAVTSISLNAGSTAGGAVVAILGSGFTGASTVNFGSSAATTFTIVSDNAIIATAPGLSAGTFDITVVTPSGTSSTSSADQFTASSAVVPAVTSLDTTSGSTAGGTALTITGSGFTGASQVLFGSVPAVSFVVNSDTLITAVAPSQTTVTTDVTVIAPGGTSSLATGDRFSYTQAATPAVTSLDTTSGSTAGGTVITVTGTNFTGASSVMFGATPAASYTFISDTQIVATAPPLAAGTVDITITTPTGTSASGTSDQFTYTAAALPSVTGVAPASGTSAGGAIVVITGSSFTGATGVNFGSTAAAVFNVDSDTQITVTAPPLAAGTVDITVVTNAGTSSTGSADHFTVSAATVPAVTAIAPTSGSAAGGTVVTVTGSNFTGATGVSFDSTAATWFTINSDGSLTAMAPSGTAGTVDVKVTTVSGTSGTSSADQFTYSSVATPTVTALSGSSGTTAGGAVITITGTGFTSAVNVMFGNYSAANFAINSDTQITAVVPPQAAGTVDVQVTNYTGTSAAGSADHFTYSNAIAPTVTALSTNNGPLAGGTIITVTGTNFTGATGVSFGASAATSFVIYSDTAIVATAPAGSAGTIDVTVTTYSATSGTSSADQFSYLTVPAITASVSPGNGSTSGGTGVTITGTSFLGTTGVTFGGVAASSFTIVSNTSITATSPAHSGGPVDIRVTNAYGTSALTVYDSFSYGGTGGGNAQGGSGAVVYSPVQIRTAYGISSLSLDGAGQTIAIVDAYDNPSIFQALDLFDNKFGIATSGPSLYQQYGAANTFLTVLNQNGQATPLPAVDPSGSGTANWEMETSLDVEWAHAVAPAAHIVLVEANSQLIGDLMGSVATAAGRPGVSVVSMSWGFPEGMSIFQSDEAAFDGIFNKPGVTFVASTGDFGTADPEYPAFSPNVLAVGGTSLTLNADNSYKSEIGWGYYSTAAGTFIGTGGGLSQYEAEPAYQRGVQSSGSRSTPDVSLVADPNTGAWIADPYNLPASNPFEEVGGTSLSAPSWAGLIVLVNQGRALAGQRSLNSSGPTEVQQDLYHLSQSDYHVITSGTNGGYNAAAGYNLVTGLGTPLAGLLVPDLVAGNFPATGQVPAINGNLNTNPGWNSSSAAGLANVFTVFSSFRMASPAFGQTAGAAIAPALPQMATPALDADALAAPKAAAALQGPDSQVGLLSTAVAPELAAAFGVAEQGWLREIVRSGPSPLRALADPAAAAFTSADEMPLALPEHEEFGSTPAGALRLLRAAETRDETAGIDWLFTAAELRSSADDWAGDLLRCLSY